MRLTTPMLALTAALLVTASAHAIQIGFAPATTLADVGDPVAVDVVVSDLGGEIVSAYDLDVVFDDAVLTLDDVSFSPALGDATLFEALFSSGAGPGVADLAAVSLLSDAELLARQGGDSVTLATLHFVLTGAGTTELGFVFDATNDVKGLDARVLPLVASTGAVRPRATNPVPEPTAAIVFGVGVLVVTRAGRRRA